MGKFCRKCNTEKEDDDFYADNPRLCKKCRITYNTKWKQKKNKEKKLEKAKQKSVLVVDDSPKSESISEEPKRASGSENNSISMELFDLIFSKLAVMDSKIDKTADKIDQLFPLDDASTSKKQIENN